MTTPARNSLRALGQGLNPGVPGSTAEAGRAAVNGAPGGPTGPGSVFHPRLRGVGYRTSARSSAWGLTPHLGHGLRISVIVCAAAVVLTACSSTTKTSSPGSAGLTPATSSPGTMFKAANVSGLGTVVVDGNGRTVYVLTSGANKNVTCDDATGCTKVWPDLPLPAGTSAATAGSGIQASLLSTMKLSDGETYPTYNGYLVYEYTGDGGPGQGHGQGIKSFGGTWYALSPAGTPVVKATTSSGGGGGY